MIARLLALGAVFAACSGEPSPEPRTARDRWVTAPPRPGSSISHTKMCECRVCEPERCCRGETTERRGDACGDSYDFSQPGCGLEVESCTGRCTKRIWRVRLDEECGARSDCC